MFRIENFIQHSIQEATTMLKGGAVVHNISKPISICYDATVKSYNMLDKKHKKQIDELVLSTLKFIDTMRPQFPKFKDQLMKLNAGNLTTLIKATTKLLRKRSTAALIQQYVDVYADVLDNPKRMKAIGAYLCCLVSNVEPKYKYAIIAAIEMIVTFITVVSHTDIAEKMAKLSVSLRKHVMRPLYKDLAKKN